jgi:hypothetical protein
VLVPVAVLDAVLVLPDPVPLSLPDAMLLAVPELPVLVLPPASVTPPSRGSFGVNCHQLKLKRSPLPPVNLKNRS